MTAGHLPEPRASYSSGRESASSAWSARFAEAVALVAELVPDVVLALRSAMRAGLDVARMLAAECGSAAPAVILVSARSPADVTELMATSPAAGFLPKADLSADAIRRIVVNGRMSGRGPLGSPAAARLIRRSVIDGLSALFAENPMDKLPSAGTDQ
jgi:two-component system, NarL family, nitrate/nitrite response regulator NarL